MSLSGTSRIILVVEDEFLIREIIVCELRNEGWQVLEARTAEDAIALMRTGHRIDLVFTDIQLAGALRGWDVAEQFRAAHAALPVIYASGNCGDPSRRVAGSLFFDKPYLPSSIVEACRNLS